MWRGKLWAEKKYMLCRIWDPLGLHLQIRDVFCGLKDLSDLAYRADFHNPKVNWLRKTHSAFRTFLRRDEDTFCGEEIQEPPHSSPHFHATGLLRALKAGDTHQFQLRLTDHLPLLPSPGQTMLDKEPFPCLYSKMAAGVSSSSPGSTP